jgi:hypothetical protein
MAKGKKANGKKTTTRRAPSHTTRPTRSTARASEKVSNPTNIGSTEPTEGTTHVNGTLFLSLNSWITLTYLVAYQKRKRAMTNPSEHGGGTTSKKSK